MCGQHIAFRLYSDSNHKEEGVSTRRILALLVVLALSLGLCSIPAGSATLQRTSVVTGEVMTASPEAKDGDEGGDPDGGDDDRWGNASAGGANGDQTSTGGDDEDGDPLQSETRLLGDMGALRMHIWAVLGHLVILL